MVGRFVIRRVSLAWLVLMMALLGAPVTQAWAAPIRTTETGVITATAFTPTRVEQVGPVTLLDATFVDHLTGFLTGTAPGTFHEFTNGRTGTAVFFGTEVCTCTAAGRSGTITIFFEGTTAPDGISKGKILFFDGTGGLAGLQGQASFRGNINLPLSYSGQFVFSS